MGLYIHQLHVVESDILSSRMVLKSTIQVSRVASLTVYFPIMTHDNMRVTIEVSHKRVHTEKCQIIFLLISQEKVIYASTKIQQVAIL